MAATGLLLFLSRGKQDNSANNAYWEYLIYIRVKYEKGQGANFKNCGDKL
jgi:hypothetical protein